MFSYSGISEYMHVVRFSFRVASYDTADKLWWSIYLELISLIQNYNETIGPWLF